MVLPEPPYRSYRVQDHLGSRGVQDLDMRMRRIMKMCSKCDRPRHVWATGRMAGYCREHQLAYDREYQAKNREKINRQHRDRELHNLYGLTRRDFNLIIALQGGGCAICQTPEDLCVDHDHQTGKVRGILCRTCNLGIGKLGDQLEGVKRAAEYLQACS